MSLHSDIYSVGMTNTLFENESIIDINYPNLLALDSNAKTFDNKGKTFSI